MTKVHIVKAMVFPVVMCGCESWAIKKAQCRRIDAFELWFWRSSLESKQIKLLSCNGNQPWILVGRTDAEAEASVLWPPDVNRLLIGKDPDAGKDWKGKKGVTEDEMVGWHHWFNGHELGQTPGDGEGHGMPQSMGSQRLGYDLAAKQQ